MNRAIPAVLGAIAKVPALTPQPMAPPPPKKNKYEKISLSLGKENPDHVAKKGMALFFWLC
jgi:hypothetical protein